ncbi:MAG: hypothetical protein PWP23_846 [Candidatus Sumerlaeota bacterium]|nr:hypothetical protein [Candidatus Sumerlaeota bacterium]
MAAGRSAARRVSALVANGVIIRVRALGETEGCKTDEEEKVVQLSNSFESRNAGTCVLTVPTK